MNRRKFKTYTELRQLTLPTVEAPNGTPPMTLQEKLDVLCQAMEYYAQPSNWRSDVASPTSYIWVGDVKPGWQKACDVLDLIKSKQTGVMPGTL